MTAGSRLSVCAAAVALLLAVAPGAAAEESEAPPPAPAAPVLEPPRLVTFAEAEYPPDVPDGTGAVSIDLELVVAIDGSVTDARVATPTGSAFEAAALEAARRFVFEPARRDGKPTPARIRYRYVFAPKAPPPPTRGVLEGKVVSRATESAATGATVTLTSEDGAVSRSVTTGPDGAFKLDELPAGAYRVSIDAPSLRPVATREEIVAGEATMLTVRLDPVVIESAPKGPPLEFGATATVEAPPREVTKRTLQADELTKVAGTRGDALRAIELLPGVARPPAGMGFVIIRGSAPTDSEVQMEGVSVPRLYHFGGLTSFVQGRLLDRIDLYPGNFSARYGRKLGGIIEVGLRDPKTDRWHELADVNVIDASVLAEGPIGKRLSLAVAFRRSYVDAFMGAIAESGGIDIVAAPVYYDYQLMTTWRPTDADRVRVIVYGSADNLKLVMSTPNEADPALRGTFGQATGFHRVQAQWRHRFSDAVEQEVSLTTGPMNMGVSFGPAFNLDVDTLDIYGRAEWRVRLTERLRLLAGIDSTLMYGDIVYRGPRLHAFEGEPMQRLSDEKIQSLVYNAWIARPAAYLELAARPTDAWQVVAGVRADYYGEISSGTVDPRLVTRYELRAGTALKAGAGLFSQPPEIPQSLRVLGNPDLRPSRGQHYSAGVEQKLGVAMIGVEGFYKRLDDLVVGAPGGGLQNGGIGRIMGAELSIRSRVGQRGFGFISYTLSRSRRNDLGSEWRRFDFDQPHILTASGSYNLRWGLVLGGTFRYVSGNPYTPVASSFYDATTDQYQAVYGAVNSARNRPFNQLDVRLEKIWRPSWGVLAAYLDVQNVYNRANQEGRFYKYDYSENRPIPGLPIIPSIGVRGEL